MGAAVELVAKAPASITLVPDLQIQPADAVGRAVEEIAFLAGPHQFGDLFECQRHAAPSPFMTLHENLRPSTRFSAWYMGARRSKVKPIMRESPDGLRYYTVLGGRARRSTG